MTNKPVPFKCMCGKQLVRALPTECPYCSRHIQLVPGSSVHMQFVPHSTELGQAIIKAADSCLANLQALTAAMK